MSRSARIRIIAAESVARGARATELPDRPYPGLRPFHLEEWPLFFGREVMTGDVIDRLLARNVVVVHGSSGCGKSSLVYAGILPQLARRASRGRGRLRIAQMRPGQAPMRTLARALCTACDEADIDAVQRIVGLGAAGAPALRARLRESKTGRICLFVDQFEELFRFARQGHSDEAALFAEFLVGLADGSADVGHWSRDGDESEAAAGAGDEALIRLIVTMRSEFLAECSRYPGLAEVINRTQYLLPMMTRFDLVRAVQEPATLFGATVDPALAQRLVEEAMEEADPLPLMQHALMHLWREGPAAMTLERYEQLTIPAPEDRVSRTGLGRLLARHANEVLDRAAGREDPVAELLFRALTDIDAEGRGIRRPQQLGSLLALVDPEDRPRLKDLVDAFRAEGASFLRPYESEEADLADDEVIDISHEALLRAWPRIADAALEPATGKPYGWLFREFEDGLIWRALAVQARLFERDETACLDEATTDRRDPWFDAFGSRAAWARRHLISRSDGAPDQEPEWLAVGRLIAASRAGRRAQRRLRRLLRGLVAAAIVLILAVPAYALYMENRRVQIQRMADERLEEALAETSRASLSAAPALPAPAAAPPPAESPEPVVAADAPEPYVWVGSVTRTALRDPRTRAKVPAQSVRSGQTYFTSTPLVARASIPDNNYSVTANMPQGSGYVPAGVAVRVLRPPVPRSAATGNQFWSRVKAPVTSFATVFIQFTGGEEDDSTGESQSDSRRLAKEVAAGLQRYGYRVPPEDRDSRASGLVELRYYYRRDHEQAILLKEHVAKVLNAHPQLRSLKPVKVVGATRAAAKPPPGTLELLLDLNYETAPAE